MSFARRTRLSGRSSRLSAELSQNIVVSVQRLSANDDKHNIAGVA